MERALSLILLATSAVLGTDTFADSTGIKTDAAAPSCTLKPGTPAVYGPICKAAKTEAACVKVNMTCSWSAPSPPAPPSPRPLSDQYWCNAPYKLCEQCNRYTNPPCTPTFRNDTKDACEKKCNPGPHPQGYNCRWYPGGSRCDLNYAPFYYNNLSACEANCKH